MVKSFFPFFLDRVRDCIASSVREDFGIYLKPAASIQKMEIISKNERCTIEGHLGFSNIRGRKQDSFEAQLEREVKSKIHYKSKETYEQLLKNFSHVVLATGDGEYAKRTRNFREDLTVSIKGSTVLREFDRYTVMAWVNYDLAPYGYGFLIPFSEKEATLCAIPDYPHIQQSLDELYERFFPTVQKQLEQDLPVTDQFQITGYPIGICRSARIGNTLYVSGNCFGCMMPFMGFGQYAALVSGVYAAYDLLGLGKYQELMKPLRKSYENSLVLRRGC